MKKVSATVTFPVETVLEVPNHYTDEQIEEALKDEAANIMESNTIRARVGDIEFEDVKEG